MKVSHEEALEILGLQDADDRAAIRKAYKRMAMKWHPDKNPDNEAEANVEFQKVGAAYSCLTGDDSNEAEDDEFDDDDLTAVFFEFMMSRMHRGHIPGFSGTFFVPPYTQRSSYVPPQRQEVPMGRPSDHRTSYAYEDYNDDSDDSEADFYFPEEEEREFLRQEQQKRQARARQQRAQELRERTARKARAMVEEQAKAEEGRVAEQRARAAAEEAELLRRVISQLPRPIMSSRTETSITLSLARLIKSSGDDKLPKQCVWELEMKGPPGGSWHTIHPMHGILSAVADRLTPGTKYIFRARAAHKRTDGSMEWGKYSEESHYATAGKSPAAESSSAAQSDVSKKLRRREAAVRKEERRPQQTAPSRSQELDEEADQQRLQAEKQKEAAIKAAQERAAQEFEHEVQQLNAMKLQNEARINEKVKKAKQKARKKEEAVNTEQAEGGKPVGQDDMAPPARELPPRPPPYRAAPVLRPYNESFSNCFGNVQRSSPAGPAPSPAPAPLGQRAGATPGRSLYEDEEMSDAEIAQLVAALEESEQTAKREAEARQATHMSDTAYPSLPTSTARPGQSIAGGVMRTHPPANKPSQHPPPGPVSGGTPHVRHQAPASPAHAQARSPMQPANAARHQNGRHVSRPSHQPPPVGQQVPAQQQEQAPRQQPSSHVVPPQLVNQQPRQALSQQPPASRVGPPSRQPARKLYSPQVQAPAGGTPHQHAPEVDWESPPEQHHQQPARKLDSPQVPAHVGSMPHQHAQGVDWEAPPEPHQHTPDLEWEPVRPMQVPAHAGSMPYQHTPDTDWEAPPEESHRQRVRPTHSTQVQPHAPGLPASTGVVPPRRLNGQPVKMPARQQPNALHEQNSIPAQQFQGYAPLPAPRASPARVKLAPPVRKAYHPMDPPSARSTPQQSHATQSKPATTLPDILQHLMPRSVA